MSKKHIYGIDLGTCNLKIFCKANGNVISEKNVAAFVGKKRLYAVGDAAYEMHEKAPEDIKITFPVANGVIADYDNMQVIVAEILERHVKHHGRGSEFIISVPTDITEVEKKAFYDVFYKSKLRPREVLLCEKPIADGIGMDLDVGSPIGYMIVNMGADTTEISVTSMGGLVISELLHFGGKRIDESIVSHLKRKYNLFIGERTACQLKESLGSAIADHEEMKGVAVGRDVVSGLPIEMEITSTMIYEAVKDSLNSICNSIRLVLERTPPELAKDVKASGIYLTGGSSKINGLSELITQLTSIQVNTCESPEESAVRGLGKIMSEESLKKLAYSMDRRIYT